MKKKFIGAVAFVVLLISFSSCSKDDTVKSARGTMDPNGQTLNQSNSSGPGGAGWHMDPSGSGGE